MRCINVNAMFVNSVTGNRFEHLFPRPDAGEFRKIVHPEMRNFNLFFFFSNPRDSSGVSQEKRIPPIAMKAHGGHVLNGHHTKDKTSLKKVTSQFTH